MNPVSYRATYTGMVRAVASWGIEIGWRGQTECRSKMTLLQNAALQKTLGAVKGSSGRKTNAIAAVKDVETFGRAASGRFFARTLCDSSCARVRQVDEGLAEEGKLSQGGHCWQRRVHIVDLGPCRTSAPTL